MHERMIPLAGMYENTSAKTGRQYFVGYLGRAKVLLMKDDRAEEGKPDWTLLIAEQPSRDKPAVASTNGRRDHPPDRTRKIAADAQAPFVEDNIEDVGR